MAQFRCRNASVNPLTRGSSGPTMVRSGRTFSANATISPTSPASTATHSASAAMPPFPGTHQLFSTRGLCFNFHTSACSRPPPPSTRTFSRNPSSTTLSNDRRPSWTCQLHGAVGSGSVSGYPVILAQSKSPNILSIEFLAWRSRKTVLLDVLQSVSQCDGMLICQDGPQASTRHQDVGDLLRLLCYAGQRTPRRQSGVWPPRNCRP